MEIKRVSEQALNRWVAGLIAEGPVYGVQAHGENKFAFDRLARAEDLRLDYDVSILPPKKYFLPQKEDLVAFSRREGSYQSVIASEPFTVFGVHPYDFVAIAQLDKIFSRGQYDMHYMARRQSAVVVVCDVQAVSEDNFAGCMHTATGRDVDGYDILLTRLPGGDYLVETRTQKGSACAGLLRDEPDAGGEELAQRVSVWNEIGRDCRRHELRMKPEEIPSLLERSYDHPVWFENSEFCYSCGSCNLVCPTCYCFTIDDEVDWNMDTGRRYRTWDGCMLEKFAEVAGGHNFREKKRSRYRHRYYRKGKYVWDAIGEISCVGCGRCIHACTAHIANPAEVFNRLLEAK